MTMAQMVAGALLWAAATGDAAAATSAPVKPLALPGTRVVPFVPGDFAGTLQHHSMTSCSQSYQTIDSHGTVTLHLAADGSATGCRSRHYRSVVFPSPLSHRTQARSGTDIFLRDQHGMRGRWRRDGEVVVIELDPDAAVCAARPERAPDAPAAWRLRCVAVEPDGKSSRLRAPALACQWADRGNVAPTPAEAWAQPGYVTSSVVEDQWWMFLGRAPGLTLEEQSVGVGLTPKMEVVWKTGAAPIPSSGAE